MRVKNITDFCTCGTFLCLAFENIKLMCRIIDKVGNKILGTYGPWLSLLYVDLMIIITTIMTFYLGPKFPGWAQIFK